MSREYDITVAVCTYSLRDRDQPRYACFMSGVRGTACIALLLSGCVSALPRSLPTVGLYRDLERVVSLAATAGWEIDRYEVAELVPSALMSVCHTPTEARTELAAWLDARIGALGGPVEDAYQKRGRKLSKVSDLLRATRVRMVLGAAMKAAGKDCPFWIKPSAQFTGRQVEDDKWQLSAGGGGKGVIARQGKSTDLRFGGAGRFVAGRAFGTRWSLLAGFEGGASASFPQDAMGNRGSLVLGFDAVVPIVLRYRMLNTYIESEAGPFWHFPEDASESALGFHLGMSIGGRAARAKWFFPGAAFTISYERTFDGGTGNAGSPLNLVKAGFRVAFDIDL